MTVPFVAKVHRQHNSLVVTIPKGVRATCGVDTGDLVVFEVQCGKAWAKFQVLLKKDGTRGKDIYGGVRRDQVRGKRAASRV